MKKFLAIAMIAATLTSCGGGETKEEATTDSPAVETTTTPAVDSPAVQAPVDSPATTKAPVDSPEVKK
jgi:ABC-type uncharacterized transport system auxiliary subunit